MSLAGAGATLDLYERHPAVAGAIATIIDGARRAGRKVGICGQAPSDYPDLARLRVEKVISSISLNPDLERLAFSSLGRGR